MTRISRTHILTLCLLGILVGSGNGGENLLPNGDFTKNPAWSGWRTAFPDEAWYRDNARWLRIGEEKSPMGTPVVEFDLGPGIAGNQGAKLESEPIPAIPGATYSVRADCMTWDFSAKLHAEAWTTDPDPTQKRTIFRRSAYGGLPALIQCYRAQIPSPPAGAREWSTAGREFVLPRTVRVAGREQVPEFLSIKVVVYGATMKAGKARFANFRLQLVNSPP